MIRQTTVRAVRVVQTLRAARALVPAPGRIARATPRRVYSTVNPTSLSAFNSNHSTYDKYRPTFDPSAVDSLLDELRLPAGATVVDLASGTGKFTALLADKGFDLSAVEVSEGMLTTFRENYPTIPAFQGSSYEIPFADNSVDAVFAAQAFHWFANDRALTEIHRVLKPGGRLVLVWNFDPEDSHAADWQRQVANTAWAYIGDLPQYRDFGWTSAFDSTPELATQFRLPVSEAKHYWAYKTPKEAVWPLWHSKSYITVLPEDEKAKVKARIEDIVAAAPASETDADGLLTIRMGVHFVWTEKL
ncbi:S-adenosyl-L-methionine-dependent methyltransferase [Dipodascopsis tothii]|uniref:S-adenosyl-L-methionine-dependent methyltransferase n=1 Tax=Dipodascopsis tothii TaxID=44089 RepID=UPI0034CD1DDD